MIINEEEWITSAEAAELLGTPQQNFLYYTTGKAKQVATHPGATRKGERLYSRADTIALRKKLARKRKNALPEKPIIDWLRLEDLLIGLQLAQRVYGPDIDLASANVYQSWRKNNQRLTMGAFNEERTECYGSIQLIPLDEQVILDVLSGRRHENSIQPDEIRSYDEPGPYTMLATSAAILPDRPHLLYELLYKYMAFWIEQFPERYMTRIYAQAMSERGAMLIQHLFMAPRPDLAYNAYEIDLSWPAASKIVRHFKAKLEEKAPLPPDLQWPPVVPVVQVPKIDVAPVADQAVKSTSPPVKARSRPSDKQREAVEEVPPDLPEGTITIAKMADQLGINRSTLAEHAKAGKLEHIAIPIASRPGKYTRYFSPEQQIAARTWHASITIKKPKQENLFDG